MGLWVVKPVNQFNKLNHVLTDKPINSLTFHELNCSLANGFYILNTSTPYGLSLEVNRFIRLLVV